MRHSVSEIMYFQMNAFNIFRVTPREIQFNASTSQNKNNIDDDFWYLESIKYFSSKFRVVIMYTSFWRKKKMMPHCRSVNSQNHRSYHSAVWLSRKVFSSLEKERKITLGKPFAQYNKCNLRIQFEFITTTLPAWRRFPAVILN